MRSDRLVFDLIQVDLARLVAKIEVLGQAKFPLKAFVHTMEPRVAFATIRVRLVQHDQLI